MTKYDYPEHHCKSAYSAIELADQLKASGAFDLFRGQRHTFDLQPSILRAGVDRSRAQNRLNAFSQWIHETPDLGSLHQNPSAILAVAQHYGIQTPLLDFTRSPRVAGFFATDGGVAGDTGTIICVNSGLFTDSWRDLNQISLEKENRLLTEIVDIEVRNLWRLQAQKGVFLRCNVAADLLEMFSHLLYIYFPQSPGAPVIEKEEVFPTARSHLEVLLDQYFLIDSYPDRRHSMQDTFGPVIESSTECIEREVAEFFVTNRVPEDDPSWHTDFAQEWLREPQENLVGEGVSSEARMTIANFKTPADLEADVFRQVSDALGGFCTGRRKCLSWVVVSRSGANSYIDRDGAIMRGGDKEVEFLVAQMIDAIYSGMRYLPYSISQIAQAIARYSAMVYFGISDVMSNPEGVEFSGGRVRGRGFCSRESVYEALRDNFFDYIHPQRLDASGKMNFQDTLFSARFVRSAYAFDRFVKLFVEDLIPSQAVVAVEGLVVGVNPRRIDILGES